MILEYLTELIGELPGDYMIFGYMCSFIVLLVFIIFVFELVFKLIYYIFS